MTCRIKLERSRFWPNKALLLAVIEGGHEEPITPAIDEKLAIEIQNAVNRHDIFISMFETLRDATDMEIIDGDLARKVATAALAMKEIS